MKLLYINNIALNELKNINKMKYNKILKNNNI